MSCHEGWVEVFAAAAAFFAAGLALGAALVAASLVVAVAALLRAIVYDNVWRRGMLCVGEREGGQWA